LGNGLPPRKWTPGRYPIYIDTTVTRKVPINRERPVPALSLFLLASSQKRTYSLHTDVVLVLLEVVINTYTGAAQPAGAGIDAIWHTRSCICPAGSKNDKNRGLFFP
jgi:hypothetical protein